jgi:hypothetical protein
MRGIALILALVLMGMGNVAAAQAGPSDTSMDDVFQGCAQPGRQARPSPLSPAMRTAILSCVARESARLISSRLPLRIDEITTLRSVAADGPQLTYFSDVEVDAAGLTEAESAALVETTRGYVCGQPAMRAAVSVGSSYRYIWFDRTGAEFNRLTIERCADEADEEADLASGDELDETPPVTIARRSGPGAEG